SYSCASAAGPRTWQERFALRLWRHSPAQWLVGQAAAVGCPSQSFVVRAEPYAHAALPYESLPWPSAADRSGWQQTPCPQTLGAYSKTPWWRFAAALALIRARPPTCEKPSCAPT